MDLCGKFILISLLIYYNVRTYCKYTSKHQRLRVKKKLFTVLTNESGIMWNILALYNVYVIVERLPPTVSFDVNEANLSQVLLQNLQNFLGKPVKRTVKLQKHYEICK